MIALQERDDIVYLLIAEAKLRHDGVWSNRCGVFNPAFQEGGIVWQAIIRLGGDMRQVWSLRSIGQPVDGVA